MDCYLNALELKGVNSELSLSEVSDEVLMANDVDMAETLIKALRGVMQE